MSKIGLKPVIITDGVEFLKNGNEVIVKGPKGQLKFVFSSDIKIVVEDKKVILSRISNDKKVRALHGLFRMLIFNAITGVVKPWEKSLEIQGTGFRAEMKGAAIQFKLGFSHTVLFDIPSDVQIVLKGNKITVSGIDKQRVGEVAAKIKAIRKPDKYKGKGIRYFGEIIKLKPGKKAKAGA